MFVEAIGNKIWKKTLFQTVPHLLSSQRRTRSCQERRLLPHVYRMPQGTKRETFRCKPVTLRWWLRCDAPYRCVFPTFLICGLPRVIHQQSFSALPQPTFVTSCMSFASTCRSRLLWKALPPHKLIGGSVRSCLRNVILRSQRLE